MTGHSLGGALATLCVLDLRTNVLPLVNARLRDRRKRRLDYGIAAARSEALSEAACRDNLPCVRLLAKGNKADELMGSDLR